ncbi:nuclear transport factor 2 family protein [Saccharothrix xinjiangensis]|uniref:Nuclear transport factor 2 family protein n=1 Tax=Saccharothrix xinjiangensis TaxID=204798 RepID=A0ABV9Y1T7_9PSEU
MGAVMDELIGLEEELWRANREGDGAFYERSLRDDAVAVSQYGVMTKADAVATIGANRNPYLKTALSDVRVVGVGDGGAAVTYRVDVVALVGEREVGFSALATTVYAREGDGWLVALHQQSPLAA